MIKYISSATFILLLATSISAFSQGYVQDPEELLRKKVLIVNRSGVEVNAYLNSVNFKVAINSEFYSKEFDDGPTIEIYMSNGQVVRYQLELGKKYYLIWDDRKKIIDVRLVAKDKI